MNARHIRLCDELIPLTPKEFDLAALFLRHPWRLFSRDDLSALVWNREVPSASRTLDTHLSNIRKKLRFGPSTGTLLCASYALGYRLELLPPSWPNRPIMTQPCSPLPAPGARTLVHALLAAACLIPPLGTHARPLGAQGNDFLYQVEPHDTLEQLSRRYTLRAEHWPTLQRLNRVDDPYRLPIGKVLRIPLSLIPEQPATATVIHVAGQVTADGRAMQPGDVLRAGQALHSTEDGTATLQLEDQSLLTLPPGTTLRLHRLESFQETGLTDTQIDIDRGTLESTVAPAGTGVGRFEVRTPATVTGVRGTRLRVHADASGSRHEVLHGGAAIEGPARTEQHLEPDRGAAYDAHGAFVGARPLLPSPPGLTLSKNGTRLDFEPIPQAAAYAVRITLDADGTRLESSRRVSGPGITLAASTHNGPRYLFVRGIDALGIEGRDATLIISAAHTGLRTSDGTAVLTVEGTPVMLD